MLSNIRSIRKTEAHLSTLYRAVEEVVMTQNQGIALSLVGFTILVIFITSVAIYQRKAEDERILREYRAREAAEVVLPKPPEPVLVSVKSIKTSRGTIRTGVGQTFDDILLYLPSLENRVNLDIKSENRFIDVRRIKGSLYLLEYARLPEGSPYYLISINKQSD
jgi:hypothetical protein